MRHRNLLLNVRKTPVRGRIGKPGKMGTRFPVREKSENFEHTGKVREDHTNNGNGKNCNIGIDLDPSKPKGMPLGLKLHTYSFTTKYINMAKA